MITFLNKFFAIIKEIASNIFWTSGALADSEATASKCIEVLEGLDLKSYDGGPGYLAIKKDETLYLIHADGNLTINYHRIPLAKKDSKRIKLAYKKHLPSYIDFLIQVVKSKEN